MKERSTQSLDVFACVCPRTIVGNAVKNIQIVLHRFKLSYIVEPRKLFFGLPAIA